MILLHEVNTIMLKRQVTKTILAKFFAKAHRVKKKGTKTAIIETLLDGHQLLIGLCSFFIYITRGGIADWYYTTFKYMHIFM